MRDRLLTATVAVLHSLASMEKCAPSDVRIRMREVSAHHAGAKIDLFAEPEPFTGTVHYDALVRVEGEGGVSIGYCPDDGAPWTVRGSFRWNELDMLRVNEKRVSVHEVVDRLDLLWNDAPIRLRLVNSAIVQDLVEREGRDSFNVTDDDLQAQMDAYREIHGLHSVEDTERWMQSRGITHESLERLAFDRALVAKIRDRFVAGRETSYFEAHRAEYDSVRIMRIIVSESTTAHALHARLVAGEVDFPTAAEEAFFANARERVTIRPRNSFDLVHRGNRVTARSSALFAARAGEIVGPFQVDGDWEIVRVLGFFAAALDEITLTSIRTQLFEEWLSERRESADIEWAWGPLDGFASLD